MPLPEDIVSLLNASLQGFNRQLGLRFLTATEDEVVAEVPVTEALLQPYGLVHGGVHCAIAETLASTGAALVAAGRGQTVVGVENATAFMRGVRSGVLRGTARPLTRGRRTQVWEVAIHGSDGKLAASGRVRLLCLEPGTEVAGEPPELRL